MVAFGDVKGEGVRFTGLATQWAALNCLAEGLDSPEEGRVRLEADHGGATTGVVYPSLARFFCLRCVVWERGEGLSGFVCAAAEVLYSHQPSTFSADWIGGVRSDGRLRDVCFGLRTVASAEQPNRREATSSLRWVLLDFLRSCFFVPLLPFVIASISLWYPDMTFGRGHTEDNDECVFMCNALFGGAQTGFIYLPLPSTIGSVLLVELVPVNT